LADTLKTSPLAPELRAALKTGLSDTFPDTDVFAVRSSAIDEDSHQHAFSGVHLTELGVPPDLVPLSITRCWASALSKEALEYRRRHGISIQSIRVAVLIQPFIRSTVAGVAFTVNPVSGAQDEILIEAVYGQAKAVVDGKVAPARYRLSKHAPEYALLDWTPGASRGTEMLHNARRVSAVVDECNPLPANELKELAAHLEQIEALMAGPQDVEWAIAENRSEGKGGLIFFQARPITSLPGTDATYDVEWSRAGFREFLPDLPSAMCMSLFQRSQNQALSLFNRLGFNTDKTGPYLKVLYGRPYLNLTLARRLLAQSGLNVPDILWIIGHTERSTNPGVRGAMDWRQVWEARRPLGRLIGEGMRVKARLDRFERLVADVRRSLTETRWSEVSPTDLLARFRLRARLCDQLTQVDFLTSAAILVLVGLAVQVAGFSSDNVGQAVRQAIDRNRRTRDIERGQRLLELATIAGADRHTLDYLAQHSDKFPDHRRVLAGTAFLAAFDSFLADDGESAAFEADPGWPRYREDPSPLLAAIAQIIKGKKTRVDQQQAASLPVDIRGPTLPPFRRWLAGLLSSRLDHLAGMRARLQTLFGQSMTSCRTWDLELATRWAARGWLVDPEDYFWLTMEEVERALMAEAEVGPTLKALVCARRETYQTYAATEMPHTLHEADIAWLVAGHGLAGAALASVLSGLPVSPGQTQGQVVVIRRPEDSSRMKEGAILVTPSTDPAWFPLFYRARGLVVETGGLLSHGSIIAREFGVPAVANIADATHRFHDGDVVLLDGSTGLIQILDAAQDHAL
jgi:pyruvate,water dikinase